MSSRPTDRSAAVNNAFSLFVKDGHLAEISVAWIGLGVAYATGYLWWPVASLSQVILAGIALFAGRRSVMPCLFGVVNYAKVLVFGFAVPFLIFGVVLAIKIHADIDVTHRIGNVVQVEGSLTGFLYLSLTAPVIEELIFRGWLQTTLRRWGLIGVIITAVFFWAFHAFNISILPLTIYVSYARERYQSLLITMAAHFVWNSGVALVALFVR